MYEPNLEALSRSLRKTFLHAQVFDESAAMQDPYRYKDEDGLRGTVTRDFMHRISENSHDEQTMPSCRWHWNTHSPRWKAAIRNNRPHHTDTKKAEKRVLLSLFYACSCSHSCIIVL